MAKKKILVVNDEVGFTRLLKVAMRQYEIREVNDPLLAIETAREFKPDLILLDVIMPGLDGGDLAARIKDDPELCHIPIGFLSDGPLGPDGLSNVPKGSPVKPSSPPSASQWPSE